MARDVEYNVTATDRSGEALRQAEENFRRSQERITKLNEEALRKRRTAEDASAARVGSALQRVMGNTAPKLQASIVRAISGSAGMAGPALAAGLAAASPLVGGVVASAVIGGAGAAGIIGGVMIASRDARVKQAGANLGRQLMAGLEADAQPFIGPLLEQIDKAEARFERFRPTLRRIFANSADFLDPVVDGALDGVEHILGGLDDLISRGGPVMDALGDSAKILGESLGKAMSTISGGSEDAASALTAFATGAGAVIEASGWLVRALTEVYGVVSYVPSKIIEFERWLGLLEDEEKENAAATRDAARAAQEQATALFQAGLRAQGVTGPIITLTEEMNDLAQGARDLWGATTNVGEALDKAAAAARRNGRTLDENTEKGRANRSALGDLAQAMIGQYNATVKVSGAGEKANAVANRNRDAFVSLASKMTGSRAAAERLADSLGLIKAPKPVRIDINSDAARRRVQALQREINSMRGRTIPITVRVTRQGETLYGNQAPQMTASRARFGTLPEGVVARTGGAEPVNVTSVVEVRLDGQPFYAATARQIDDDARRRDWERRVGRRNAGVQRG